MQRRGLRLETDHPTERQVRNSAWLASHPAAVATVSAVLFGLLGAGYGSLEGGPTPLVGGLLGVIVGVLLGVGLSVENRREHTRRSTIVYVVTTVVAFGIVLAARVVG